MTNNDASREEPSQPGGHQQSRDFVPLVTRRWWFKAVVTAGLLIATALAVVPVIVVGPNRIFDTADQPLWISLVSGSCRGMGLFVLFMLGSLYFRRSPLINLSARSFKIRGKVVPFSEVDTAIMSYRSRDKNAGIVLTFGREHGPKASIRLHAGSAPPADGSPRAQLVEAFRESSIVTPQNPYDPSGKFARHNFPGYLDKDAAIAVLENPPRQFTSLP